MTTLRGITWAHSRGFTPLVAASEAWHDLRNDVEIRWEKRSFWGFGEGSLEEVARDYDLIVFDHPHTGTAAEAGLFVPYDIPVTYCVGECVESYYWAGALYGLPIDAACQTAACRPDLLDRPPANWEEVIELASRTGGVRCAFSPMGALGMLHSLAAGLGSRAGHHTDHYFKRGEGLEALHRLRALFEVCRPASLDHSPVRILAEMATGDDVIYAPLLYCYSNYSRDGFAPHRIRFMPPPGTGSTLGGAGLAVSAFSQHREAAMEFAHWLISDACQHNVCLYAQGQPALRPVWISEDANRLTHGFFADLLETMEDAYLRPNFPGYGEFQSAAAGAVHEFLKGGLDALETLRSIDRMFAKCPSRDIS